VKNIIPASEKIPRTVYIVLLSLAGALIVLIFIGTVVGLARSKDSEPLIKIGGSSRTNQTGSQADDIRIFSGLGQLRIPLANSSTLLLTIAFPYSAGDITFTEELAAKIGDFRAIAISYFSALPAESITQIDEETAKQEILRRYNNNLRLGRIRTIYFSDMMVIDSY